MYIKLILSAFKIFFLKIVYPRKLKISWIQFFGNRTSIIITGNSFVSIEKGTTSRSNLNIRAENANLNISYGVFFNHNCSITALNKILIGHNCSFGNNVVIVDHDHNYKLGKDYITSEVIIGNNVWVGSNCVILRGTNIGNNSVVAAGTTIKGDFAENSIIMQSRTLESRPINYLI